MLVGRCPRQREQQMKEPMPEVWKNSRAGSTPGAQRAPWCIGRELRGSGRQMTQGLRGHHGTSL